MRTKTRASESTLWVMLRAMHRLLYMWDIITRNKIIYRFAHDKRYCNLNLCVYRRPQSKLETSDKITKYWLAGMMVWCCRIEDMKWSMIYCCMILGSRDPNLRVRPETQSNLATPNSDNIRHRPSASPENLNFINPPSDFSTVKKKKHEKHEGTEKVVRKWG